VGMARQAIHAVQLQVLLELWEAEEALERGGFHAWGIGEAHVVGDQSADMLGIGMGEAEPGADLLRHALADFYMTVKADAVGRDAEGGRLSHVMQQRAERERRRSSSLQFLQEEQCVDPDIALRVELRRLLHTFHALDLREKFVQ